MKASAGSRYSSKSRNWRLPTTQRSPERRRVPQLGQDAQFVEAAVDLLALEDVRLPAAADEAGRRVLGDIPGILGVQIPEHLNRLEQLLAGRRGPELEGVEEPRRVPADVRVTVADQRQVVEILGARELRRFLHAGEERFPRHQLLDLGERVDRLGLGLDQRLADGRVEPHLLIDRLAALLEGVEVPALRLLELPADRPLVHLQHLVGERRRRVQDHRHQRRVPPFVAEIPEVRGVRVGPFAGGLREPVLVDPQRPVAGDAEITKDGEPPDTLEDVGGIGCPAGLSQPAEVRQPGVGIRGQQFIQSDALPGTEVDGQCPVCLAAGPMSHGRSQAVEHGEGRGQDASPPQLVQKGLDQREATIRAACQRDQPSRTSHGVPADRTSSTRTRRATRPDAPLRVSSRAAYPASHSGPTPT